MTAFSIPGRITPEGTLEVQLPPGLPPGDVRLTIELADAHAHPAPLTGAEIVAAGLTGTWPTDTPSGADWVIQRRQHQRDQRKW